MHNHDPLKRCAHGERQDRTTILGESICALCRTARRRYDGRVDWQAIRAGDDLWDDDADDTTSTHQPDQQAETPALAGLFAPESGRRVEAIARRARDRHRDLVLF